MGAGGWSGKVCGPPELSTQCLRDTAPGESAPRQKFQTRVWIISKPVACVVVPCLSNNIVCSESPEMFVNHTDTQVPPCPKGELISVCDRARVGWV